MPLLKNAGDKNKVTTDNHKKRLSLNACIKSDNHFTTLDAMTYRYKLTNRHESALRSLSVKCDNWKKWKMRAKDRKLQDRRGKTEGSKRTQFQTGDSGGNPKGRPKNITVVDVIQKARAIGDDATVEAFEQLQTNFIKAAANAALKGDAKAIGMLAKFFFRPLAPQTGDPLSLKDLDLSAQGITESLRRITEAMATGQGDPASLKALFDMVNQCGESHARDAALRLVAELEADEDEDDSD